jgi:hypothetical protein
MKLKPAVIVAAVEILGAVAEVATAILDGKPETKPDFHKLLSRILAALAGMKAP